MSKLTTKQESYSHFKGISFDEASYTLTPTITGNRLWDGNSVFMSSDSFVRDGLDNPEIVTGPMPGQNAYKFTSNDVSSPQKSSRLYFGSTTPSNVGTFNRDVRRLYWDREAVSPATTSTLNGIWIKTPASFSLNGTTGIHRLLGTANTSGTLQNIMVVGVGANASSQPIININHQPEFQGILSPTSASYNVEWDKWYFVAIKRSVSVTSEGSIGTISTGTLSYTHYINGVEVGTITSSSWRKASVSAITWGHNNPTPTGHEWSVSLAGWFVTDWDAVGAEGLEEIYATFSNSVNVADVLTASSFQTEPTIIISANDNIEVTTSFLASATIPNNITVVASQNINVVITGLLEASADINHADVNTPTSLSFTADSFIASAILAEARVSEVPMTAQATLLNPTIFVTPSYYSLVKNLNPLFYTNLDSSTITNFGSWSGVTSSVGTGVTKNLASTNNMGLIGEGKSWRFANNTSANVNFVKIIPENPNTTIGNLVLEKNYTLEAWTKINNEVTGVYSGFSIKFGNIIFKIDRSTDLPEPNIVSENPGIYLEANDLVFGFDGTYGGASGLVPQNSTNYFISTPDVSLIKINDWNHVVIRVSGNNVSVYINGSFCTGFTKAIDTTAVSNNSTNYDEVLIFDGYDTNDGGAYIDEIAIYNSALSNSDIIDHFSFINNKSPNSTVYSTPLIAVASEQNHQFYVISNANVSSAVLTCSAESVQPNILAQRTINFVSDTLNASAENTNVTVYYGRTFVATPMICYAEKAESYFLDDLYYQYVQTNIAPYRYVTFDSANAGLDYGTDNDYSVAPTTIGGTVVNPDLGINGKSVKTTGASYVTDGVILKESEWNDSWGTGANDWHSAFWFQRALDDNSTTGLRVLWNLNGYKDNQHAVLYQYQGRLHMQFNNGSGTFIETDSTALDLFDYQRHFIVIDHNHGGGNNNTIKLYVDSVLRFTVNIGSITPTTTNAATADSGSNDEANNRARLSVGCLITPFGSTAFPVQPTTTKLIIDEIYWDKNSITQTQVTNLYNAMPDKTNKQVVAEPFIASDELVMPAISRSSAVSAAPFTASGSLVQPVIIANREVVATANVMTASAIAGNAILFEDRIITSDVFVATAIFNNAGIKVGFPGGPMLASVKILDQTFKINGWSIVTMTPYVRYLRISNYQNRNIKSMKEIK